MDFISLCKDKRVYHISDSDLDGVSCRLLAEYYVKPVCKNYFPFNTSDRNLEEFDFDLASTVDYIIFTDIAPPSLEFYNKINEKKNVFIFDHHQSHRDYLGDLDNYYFDLDRCGTKIFYDHLTSGRRKKAIIDQYVNLANTYDLYLTDSEDWDNAKSLHNILYGYVDWRLMNFQTDTERYEKFIDMQLKKFYQFDNFFFSMYEKKIIFNAQKKEETMYKQAKKHLQIRVDGEGNNYAYTECSSKISLVAHRLMSELADKIEYIAIYSLFNKSDLKLSLRSPLDFNTTYISEKWGGGGHKNASGMCLTSPEEMENFRTGNMHLI